MLHRFVTTTTTTSHLVTLAYVNALWMTPDALSTATPEHISNCLVGLANTGLHVHQSDQRGLIWFLMQQLHKATPQCLANSVAAVAKLGGRLSPHEMQCILQHVQQPSLLRLSSTLQMSGLRRRRSRRP